MFAIRSLLKNTKRLLKAVPKQLWFLLAIAGLGLAAYFNLQVKIESLFGWSAIPFGIWLAITLFLLIFNRAQLLAKWRWIFAAFAASSAISGMLGIFYAPVGSLNSESYGGDIGIFISRAPVEWTRFNVSILEYSTAWLRIAIVLLIGFGVGYPKQANKTGKLSVRIFSSIFSFTKSTASLFHNRFNAWRIERSQVKALQRADQAAYEAARLTQSHNNVTKTQPASVEIQHAVSKPSTSESSVNPKEVIEVEKDDLAKFVERMPEDPATPITVAYPTPSELKAAAKETAPTPDYSAAQKFPWQLPSTEMLAIAEPGGITKQEVEYTSLKIEESLSQFGIDVSVDQVRQGPTVTMYGLSPGWKGRSEENTGQRVRVDTILNREKDIALALASPNLRFEAPVPGESVVGIEVPNAHPTAVTLHSVMQSTEWSRFKETAALPVPLGLGSGGDPVMADLSRMPHTLVAGSTGSGKSVCMNAIITGLILTKTPLEVRLIMIDPKRVELTPYQGIPHLYHPVIVESDRAVIVLRSLVDEMMGRFRQLENAGVKNIASYNEKMAEKMPYLVILVDELADLMLTAAGDVERLLVRLAQLGRATGVHLVIATQRPSVDVVTGLIKANFPSRISFAVMSQIDSRTILDSVGAEKLLGRGDMLYMPIDKPKPSRVQGAFLTDNEIEGIVSTWKDANPPPLPELVVSFEDTSDADGSISNSNNGDSLFEQAASLAHSQKTLSVSLLQRRLRIGYPRAARLMDELEDEGIVGAGEPGKPRPVL